MAMQHRLTELMISQILKSERYAIRFEDLCIGTFNDVRQIEYVRTSRTYDLGRDSRALAHGTTTPPIICCGTGTDSVKKASDDLTTILGNLEPQDLLFCFTDPTFSEDKEAKIKGDVTNRCSQIRSVEAYGGDQLAQIIAKHPATFEELYAGELSNLRSALSISDGTGVQTDLTGLRLALTTQLHDDAQDRRRDIVRNLILNVLATGKSLTPKSLAKEVTEKLHLPKSVQESWLTHDLNQLVDDKLIALSPDGNAYKIAPKGREELEFRTVQGMESFITGKDAVRKGIEDLLGYGLSESEFPPVWNLLQSELAALFVSHGGQLIESIVAVALRGESLNEQTDLRTRIKDITRKLKGGPTSGTRSAEIAQAVEDLFHERSSPAFLWLADLAEVFLQLCALGLEPNAQSQILARVQEVELLLDTDIVLSLLSPGEPNHKAILAMVTAWNSIGGKLHVVSAALEEVAYHAWIADREFKTVLSSIDRYSDSEALHLIENVFVRGFRHESRESNEKCTQRRWTFFINAFRGKQPLDYAKIFSMLHEDFGVGLLEEEESDQILATDISTRLFNDRKSNSRTDSLTALQGKYERDGRTSVVALRYRAALAPSNRTAVVVSTSHSLRLAVAKSKKTALEDGAVWYSTAVLWLLSLVPGVKITASSLQAVMFDVDFPIALDPVDRKSLRLFRESDEYRIHYSRRATLRDAVRGQIKKRAAQLGADPEQIHAEFLNESADNQIAKSILAQAVDEIARSRSEQRITELEDALAREKSVTQSLRQRIRRPPRKSS
jgi:hypothetical protein